MTPSGYCISKRERAKHFASCAVCQAADKAARSLDHDDPLARHRLYIIDAVGALETNARYVVERLLEPKYASLQAWTLANNAQDMPSLDRLVAHHAYLRTAKTSMTTEYGSELWANPEGVLRVEPCKAQDA